jgi:hypothetical protein
MAKGVTFACARGHPAPAPTRALHPDTRGQHPDTPGQTLTRAPRMGTPPGHPGQALDPVDRHSTRRPIRAFRTGIPHKHTARAAPHRYPHGHSKP